MRPLQMKAELSGVHLMPCDTRFVVSSNTKSASKCPGASNQRLFYKPQNPEPQSNHHKTYIIIYIYVIYIITANMVVFHVYSTETKKETLPPMSPPCHPTSWQLPSASRSRSQHHRQEDLNFKSWQWIKNQTPWGLQFLFIYFFH